LDDTLLHPLIPKKCVTNIAEPVHLPPLGFDLISISPSSIILSFHTQYLAVCFPCNLGFSFLRNQASSWTHSQLTVLQNDGRFFFVAQVTLLLPHGRLVTTTTTPTTTTASTTDDDRPCFYKFDAPLAFPTGSLMRSF
jgi:hypothetical protein